MPRRHEHRRARRARRPAPLDGTTLLDKVEDLRKALAWNQSEVKRLGGAPPADVLGTTGRSRRLPPRRRRRRRASPLPETLEENVYDRTPERTWTSSPWSRRSSTRWRTRRGSWSTSAHTGVQRSDASTRPGGRLRIRTRPASRRLPTRKHRGGFSVIVDRRAVTNHSGDLTCSSTFPRRAPGSVGSRHSGNRTRDRRRRDRRPPRRCGDPTGRRAQDRHRGIRAVRARGVPVRRVTARRRRRRVRGRQDAPARLPRPVT